jgi:hypothetical protein
LDCPEKITELVGTDMLMIKNLIHIYTITLGVTSQAEYYGVALALLLNMVLDWVVAKELAVPPIQETWKGMCKQLNQYRL